MIGTAGYIAPRHLKAIKDTGNTLLAAMDKNDSVGIMDSFFPEAMFFTEFEQFQQEVDLLNQSDRKPHYTAITSPNYLHSAHIRFALNQSTHAICEKPLVLNPSDLDQLTAVEAATGFQVYNILQLRLHPSIIDLRNRVKAETQNNPDKVYEVDLTYLTSRGNWYFTSWKGDNAKSGGIATNIGVHFFDMLGWVFGPLVENQVHVKQEDANAGYLEFKHARVRWFLSVNYAHIPEATKASGARTYRSITVDDTEIEFSDGFTELHTRSYEEILKGNGFGLEEARNSIEIVSNIRHQQPSATNQSIQHPFIKAMS